MALHVLAIFTIIVICCSGTVPAPAGKSDLATLNRVFVPIQLRGRLLYRGSKIEAGIQCQGNTILHEDIRSVPGREDIFWVPHSLIVQDGKRCGTGKSSKEFMTVVPGKSIIRSSTAKELGLDSLYRELLSNRRALNAFGKLHAVDPVHIGFELTAHRRCGDKIQYPRGSVFLFLSSSLSKLNLGFASFRAGQVAMVTVLNNQNLCAYQDDFSDNNHPYPAPSQTPTTTITPAPSQAFNQLEPPIASLTVEASKALNPTELPKTTPRTSTSGSSAQYSSKGPSVCPIPLSTPLVSPSTSTDSPVDLRSAQEKKCFPNNAIVELHSGTRVPISSLTIGSEVRTGPTSFSTVFMFTHNDKDARSQFVRLYTSRGGAVALSEGHYVKVNGKLTAARHIGKGDALQTSTGEDDTVIRTELIFLQGLHNPQTLDGSIIVDGFIMSVYTEAVNPFAAEALLLPIKAAYRLGLYRDVSAVRRGNIVHSS